ncbi:MAG: LPS export ABC transporter permease LptG [Nitrospira sp.]|nr:LPS export ABC transporter permease LptG [Nitrospira sp.]
MGILFWYIVRQYLGLLTLCLTGLVTIYLVIDFFEKLRRFLRHDADLSSMLLYFVLKIPDISFQLMPFAVLMASLLTIGLLNKNHEITAMRSCGVSLVHVTIPFLAVAGLVTVILLGLTAVVIPLANAKAEYLRTVKIQKKPQPLSFTSENLWVHTHDHSLMHVERVDPDGTWLRTVTVYRLNNRFSLDAFLTATGAVYTDGEWSLHDVVQRVVDPDGGVETIQWTTLPLALSLTPADLMTWNALEPEHMTLNQLGTHIERLRLEKQNATKFLADYWRRVAFASVPLIMTILGVSIGLLETGTRTASIGKGIGQALSISFLFWATNSVGMTLGKSGALLPVVAAWIACVMFLIVSLNIFLKVRY